MPATGHAIVTAINVVVIMVLGAAAMWWLSGWDSKVAGDNSAKDIVRRSIRCLASAFLIWIFFFVAPLSHATIPLILIIPISLGWLWRGPISELLSHGFRHVAGISASDRAVAPDEDIRQLEELAAMIRSGRREEAAQLAKTLLASGQVNPLVLEALLDRAGIPYQRSGLEPLKEARRLRTGGKTAEAETLLKSLLAANPSDMSVAMVLIRLYVEDLRRSDKAMEVLRKLQTQPKADPVQIEYAHRYIQDPGRKTQEPKASLPESIDDLLMFGYLGTAIEILEQKLAAQPDDFETRLKLAEAHGLHSGNLARAKKIIGEMESMPCFTADQVRAAKDKLGEWAQARRGGNRENSIRHPASENGN
jgi:Tetratricopeptide repeat